MIVVLHHHHLCTVILATSLMGATSCVACILTYFPHKCMFNNLGISLGGHIWCWHIFCSSMLNKCCWSFIFDGCVQHYEVNIQNTLEVQWDIHVQCVKHICFGTYVSNVKCMYTSTPGYMIDSFGFTWGKCSGILVSCAYKVIGICGIYIWHLRGMLVVSTYIVIAW